jgi:hypothetical protein
MQSMTIDSAATRLTETILGDEGPDLEQTLKAIATNIGLQHIAYAPLSSEKSEDANLLGAQIVEGLERDSRSEHGHSPCRPSKRRDRPRLQPTPRATSYAEKNRTRPGLRDHVRRGLSP